MKYSDKICTCVCHQKNTMIMHCFPCCDYCDIKYLNEKGEIIKDNLPKKLKDMVYKNDSNDSNDSNKL